MRCVYTCDILFQGEDCPFGGSGSFSREFIVGSVMRVGCDDVRGSGKTPDACGVCGGRDDCVDCAGTENGGKLLLSYLFHTASFNSTLL